MIGRIEAFRRHIALTTRGSRAEDFLRGSPIGALNRRNRPIWRGGNLWEGHVNTEAYGLNDKGDIVGKFLDGPGEHGFLLSGGTVTTIDIPVATLTDAFGINNRGQIVEHFPDANGSDGFLLSPREF